MRFAIAASVLATTLPPGLAFRKQPNAHQSIFNGATKPGKKAPLQQLLHLREDGRQSEFGKKHPFYYQSNGAGLLKNFGATHSLKECNPEAEADIGVLGCGTNEYCTEVPRSSMGGVCVPKNNKSGQRVLHYDGIHAAYLCGAYPNPFCDCSAWDSDTETGIIECSYDVGCAEGCGLTLCFSYSLTYANDGETGMFTYFVGYSGSYERNLTLSGESDFDGDSACEIVIDGIACSYCAYATPTCVNYDCTNAGEGTYNCTDGSGYGIYIFDNVPYCNETLECNLCSEGEFVADTNAKVELPFGDYTCGYIYGITESGAYNIPQLCQYFIYFAGEACCHEMFAPSTSPTVSFDEESPDEESPDEKSPNEAG